MILSAEQCDCAYSWTGPSMAGSCGGGAFLVFMTLLESYISGRCDLADPCRRVQPPAAILDEYDFVVVGGGAAGPVLANRLSENKTWNVLLLEAGGDEPIPSSVPSFYSSYWDNPETDWMYSTQPQDQYCQDQAGGRCKWTRGKVLGGCTVMNGMMYHRGHPADYAGWVADGAEGWSWEDNLPYFNKAEDNKQIGSLVEAKYHATGGPIPIQRFRYQPALALDLLTGIQEAGYPTFNDINDNENPTGFTIAQAANEGGSRVSMARAYLRPVSRRQNLHVLLHAQATKIVFNENKVASGVEFYLNGERKSVSVSKEVILTAGTLNTPQLLMLSGVGPKATLEEHDIPVVADLAGVGRNLQNHIGVNLFFELEKLPAVQDLDWSTAMTYLLTRDGPMSATGTIQLTGSLYSSHADAENKQPDITFSFNGFYANCSRTGSIGERQGLLGANKSISITGMNLVPRSVGHLTLNSSDPFDPPLFYPNYFSNSTDMEILKEAAKIIYNITNTDVLKSKWGFVVDKIFTPRCYSAGDLGSDEFLECMIRTYTDPQNHQVGTARIGRRGDPAAVVDSKLNVYGVKGVRVADASAMPRVVTGNPFAAVVMIAERASDFIKSDYAKAN